MVADQGDISFGSAGKSRLAAKVVAIERLRGTFSRIQTMYSCTRNFSRGRSRTVVEAGRDFLIDCAPDRCRIVVEGRTFAAA